MLKKIMIIALSGSLMISPVASAEELLTGDTRLACEAILCLSSDSRPSECTPSLDRYFGITHKKMHKQIQKRRDFLNLCPSAGEEGMPGLIEALSEGAGRCDAAFLNRRHTMTVCKEWLGTGCKRLGRTVDPTPPSYCRAYQNHQWTDLPELKYVCDRYIVKNAYMIKNHRVVKNPDAEKTCASGHYVD